MKRFLIGFWVLFGLVAPCFGQGQTAGNVESFDRVWKTVNDSHFDPTFGGVDWEAMRDRYRPKIISSSGIEDFNRITNHMLFELGVSHLLVATEKMLKTYMPTLFSEGTVGMDVRWMQNSVVITEIRPGYPAQMAGLKTGYEIKAIDGRDVREIIRAAEVLPPYNVRHRRGVISSFIVGHLNGPPQTSVCIRYVDDRSVVKEVTVLRRSRGAGKIVSKAMPPVFIEFEAKRLKDNIGYMRFNHFAAPVDKACVRALETLRDTRGLIFDVRGNPGGYFQVMDAIVEQLITEQTRLYRLRFRDKTVHKTLTPSKHPYEKPVVVLIDVASMSCSEQFATCLQAIGRAAVVGNRSPGYLLGAKWTKLPNGLSFMHPILQPVPFDGRIVEGHGIKPDLDVALNRDDLLKGRDTQLEAAMAYLLEKDVEH